MITVTDNFNRLILLTDVYIKGLNCTLKTVMTSLIVYDATEFELSVAVISKTKVAIQKDQNKGLLFSRT